MSDLTTTLLIIWAWLDIIWVQRLEHKNWLLWVYVKAMNVPRQVFSAHMTEFVKQQLSWMGWNLKTKAAAYIYYQVDKAAKKSITVPVGPCRIPASPEKLKSLFELVHSFDLSYQLAQYTAHKPWNKLEEYENLSLQKLTCIQEITKFIRWSKVSSGQDKDTVYELKTLTVNLILCVRNMDCVSEYF